MTDTKRGRNEGLDAVLLNAPLAARAGLFFSIQHQTLHTGSPILINADQEEARLG